MWRFGLRQTGRLALGLFGAALLAASVAVLSGNSAGAPLPFGAALARRLVAMSRLDFGSSTISGAPAWMVLSRALPHSLEIIVLGSVIAVLIGLPAGIVLSERRALKAGAPLLQMLSSIPLFCAALVFLFLSQRWLHWVGGLPRGDLASAMLRGDGAAIAAALKPAAFPALTVGVAGAYSVQSVLRRAIQEAANEPYRKGLRALGLTRLEIDRLYVFPVVLSRLFRSLGEIVLSLTGAAAVAEWIFAWPGAADLFLKSVALEDWMVVGLVLFVFATFTMAAEYSGAIMARLLAETGPAS